jgi:hypothetical protein
MNQKLIKEHLSSMGTEINEVRFEMLSNEPSAEKMWSNMSKVIAMCQQVQTLLGINPLVPAAPQQSTLRKNTQQWVLKSLLGGSNRRERDALNDITEYVTRNPEVQPSQLHKYCESKIHYWSTYDFHQHTSNKGKMGLSASYDPNNNGREVKILSERNSLVLIMQLKEVAA